MDRLIIFQDFIKNEIYLVKEVNADEFKQLHNEKLNKDHLADLIIRGRVIDKCRHGFEILKHNGLIPYVQES